MPPSLRFTHPTSADTQHIPSTSLVSPTSSFFHNVTAKPLDEAARTLRFHARVPMPGMHSSNHSSDAIRTQLHLSNPRTIDIDPLEPIEFDDIAVRETDIPPNPDDDDELPSMHFPVQGHNRPASPPQFRDFNLPTNSQARPEEEGDFLPSAMLGIIPDNIATSGYEVPFLIEGNGFGRRIPARMEGLSTFPGRHQLGRNQQP